MKISFFNPQDFEGNIKATIHSSGKLGFTEAAIEKLEIGQKAGARIGINESDSTDKNLYVLLVDAEEEGAFKISKAGAYYYINTKTLFDNMQVPYNTSRISYDIVPIIIEGVKMYKFLYREKAKEAKK